jgi:hypothetical protein
VYGICALLWLFVFFLFCFFLASLIGLFFGLGWCGGILRRCRFLWGCWLWRLDHCKLLWYNAFSLFKLFWSNTGFAQAGSPQVGPAQVGSAQVGIIQSGPAQIGSAQISSD